MRCILFILSTKIQSIVSKQFYSHHKASRVIPMMLPLYMKNQFIFVCLCVCIYTFQSMVGNLMEFWEWLQQFDRLQIWNKLKGISCESRFCTIHEVNNTTIMLNLFLSRGALLLPFWMNIFFLGNYRLFTFESFG